MHPVDLQQMSVFTTAAQNHLSSSVVVFIKVLDINDNVPRLARDYQPYICEGTQAGEVCILWCTDFYDLLPNFFNVDSQSSYTFLYSVHLFKYESTHKGPFDYSIALFHIHNIAGCWMSHICDTWTC